jgi:hypothetical protein
VGDARGANNAEVPPPGLTGATLPDRSPPVIVRLLSVFCGLLPSCDSQLSYNRLSSTYRAWLPRRVTAETRCSDSFLPQPRHAPPLRRRCGNSPGLLLSVVLHSQTAEEPPPWFPLHFHIGPAIRRQAAGVRPACQVHNPGTHSAPAGGRNPCKSRAGEMFCASPLLGTNTQPSC